MNLTMNIRPKVIALVAGLFGALIVMEVLIQEYIIMPSFTRLERADARTSMTRVAYALDRTLEGLESTAADWSDWGELYQFMQNRNHAFLDTYTTLVAMAPLKVNLLLLVDPDGTVVFAAGRELESGAPLPIDLAGRTSLPQDFPWRKELAGGRSVRGLVRTDRGERAMAAPLGLAQSGERVRRFARLREHQQHGVFFQRRIAVTKFVGEFDLDRQMGDGAAERPVL